jgi:hypothetical protein
MFKVDPATAFVWSNPLASSSGAGGGSGTGGGGFGGGAGNRHAPAVSRRTATHVTLLSILLFVLLLVRQVVYDSVASLSLAGPSLHSRGVPLDWLHAPCCPP